MNEKTTRDPMLFLTIAGDEITQVLIDERPTAMDKTYYQCDAWERGTCDEWNTTVLAFAGLLFPVATFGMARRQAWIDALVSNDKIGAFSVVKVADGWELSHD